MGLALGVAMTSASCGEQIELVVVNRSDTPIAFLPGMVVGPCSEVGYTDAQIKAAQDAYQVALDADDASWIPPGAVQFERGIAGQRIGAPKPQTLIISGALEPNVVDGNVAASQLPACGGPPIGIE